MNSGSMTEYKTDMNITEKTEQHFYEVTLNKTQLHFGKSNNKHIQIKKPQNSPRKRLTKIFNQQLTSIHYLYP